MRRTFGALVLGLSLVGAAPVALADDAASDAVAALEDAVEDAQDDGSNRNLILAAILAVVVIGGGIAMSRRGQG